MLTAAAVAGVLGAWLLFPGSPAREFQPPPDRDPRFAGQRDPGLWPPSGPTEALRHGDGRSPSLAQSALALRQGDRQEALRVLDMALLKGPPSPVLHHRRVSVMLVTLPDWPLEAQVGRIEVRTLQKDPMLNFVVDALREDPSGRLVDALLEGRDLDLVEQVRRRGPQGAVEIELPFSLGQHNLGRYADAERSFRIAWRELPTRTLAAWLALAQLGAGMVREAEETLDQGAALPGASSPAIPYLRALCRMAQGRPDEAEKELGQLPDGLPRRYTQGLIGMSRRQVSASISDFEACGEHYAALYHRACLEAGQPQGGERALDLLRRAVNHAKACGVYDRSVSPVPRELVRATLPFLCSRSKWDSPGKIPEASP